MKEKKRTLVECSLLQKVTSNDCNISYIQAWRTIKFLRSEPCEFYHFPAVPHVVNILQLYGYIFGLLPLVAKPFQV